MSHLRCCSQFHGSFSPGENCEHWSICKRGVPKASHQNVTAWRREWRLTIIVSEGLAKPPFWVLHQTNNASAVDRFTFRVILTTTPTIGLATSDLRPAFGRISISKSLIISSPLRAVSTVDVVSDISSTRPSHPTPPRFFCADCHVCEYQ